MNKDELSKKVAEMVDSGEELKAVYMLSTTAIDKIMSSRLEAINESEPTVEAVRDALVDCINTTEAIHGLVCMKALVCMAGADHETCQETGISVLREGYLKDLLEAILSDFEYNLRKNLSEALEENGYPNFLDPNRKLREELLQ